MRPFRILAVLSVAAIVGAGAAVDAVAAPESAAPAQLSETRRLPDRRFVVTGDGFYQVGAADGSYPATGWHIRGEMGGFWTPPIKLLDGLWFGAPDQHFERAVAGIGGYGNSVGIANLGGQTVFDEAYAGNCLVNAMCVGILDPARLQSAKAAGPDNLVVLYGATTGRDGIGGASVLAPDTGALAALFPVLRRVSAVNACIDDAGASAAHHLRRRAATALRGLLCNIARSRPVVLVLDDLQWGDQDSTPFLTELAQALDVPGVLVAATYRNDGDAPLVAALQGR